MNDDETATTGSDPIKVDCDWHYQRDKKVLFDFRVERQGRKAHVEVLIDLLTLDSKEAERLNWFLERQHKDQTSLTERARAIAFLLDLSLQQQRPSSTQGERNAEVRHLLLFKDTIRTQDNADPGQTFLSAKQTLFEDLGQNFINSTGQAVFFEDCKNLPHYQEIRESCLLPQEAFNFGTPAVPTASPAEQALAEMFFFELQHAQNPSAVLAKYDPLIQPHWHDQRWLDAIADVIKRRLKGDQSRPLDFCLLGGWTHCGLWGLSNQDRNVVLDQVYGLKTTAEILRQHVRILKLRDWADFKNAYPSPPLEYVISQSSETGEKSFQLSIRSKYRKWLKNS